MEFYAMAEQTRLFYNQLKFYITELYDALTFTEKEMAKLLNYTIMINY